MPRDIVPLSIPDLSAFARNLRAEITDLTGAPGHQDTLNIVARAAGYRNHQHLRAATRPRPPKPAVNRRVAAALRHFDEVGRLVHWPRGQARQGLCLWPFWARLPVGRDLSEPEVNAILASGETFGDHVILRRSLVDHGLVTREPDGSAYRRVERDPPPDARALLDALETVDQVSSG